MAGSSSAVAVDAFVLGKVVEHLRTNSGGVKNMDMMTTTGFCRNCLSKWYLAGARQAGLASVTYADACERVYGMPYAQWKAKFQAKATADQLERYNASKPMHAAHDPSLDFSMPPPPPLPSAPLADGTPASSAPAPQLAPQLAPQPSPPAARPPVVSSDVCCQEPGVGDASASAMATRVAAAIPATSSPLAPVAVRLGVLTVSDRAHAGVYEDKSGPEVRACVEAFVAATQGRLWTLADGVVAAVVPDEQADIQTQLVQMAETCDLVLTTGGTGLARRDVTPEATLAVVGRNVPGIPEAIRRETSVEEPLAVLSRAVAGIREDNAAGHRTLIINLPGRPKACRESMAVVLPVLGQALSQLLSNS